MSEISNGPEGMSVGMGQTIGGEVELTRKRKTDPRMPAIDNRVSRYKVAGTAGGSGTEVSQLQHDNLRAMGVKDEEYDSKDVMVRLAINKAANEAAASVTSNLEDKKPKAKPAEAEITPDQQKAIDERVAKLDSGFVEWLDHARYQTAQEFILGSDVSRRRLSEDYERYSRESNSPNEKAKIAEAKNKVDQLEKENGNPGWIKQVIDEVARTGTAVLVAEVVDFIQDTIKDKKSAYKEAGETLKAAEENEKAGITSKNKSKLDAAAAIVNAFERQAQTETGVLNKDFKKELRGEVDEDGNFIINGAIQKVLDTYLDEAADFRATRPMGQKLGDPSGAVKEALDKAFERHKNELRNRGELTDDVEEILQKYRAGFDVNLRIDKLLARRNLYSELGDKWKNQLKAVDSELRRIQEEVGDTSTRNPAANATRSQMREVFQDWWENEGATDAEIAQIKVSRANPDSGRRVRPTGVERLRQRSEEYMVNQGILPADIDKFRSGSPEEIQEWMAGKLVDMDSAKKKVAELATRALKTMLSYLKQFRPELNEVEKAFEAKFDKYEALNDAASKVAVLETLGSGVEGITTTMKAEYCGANFGDFVDEINKFLPLQVKADKELQALRAWLDSGNSPAAREGLKRVLFGEIAPGTERSQKDELAFIEYLAGMQMLGVTSSRDAYIKNPLPGSDRLKVFNRDNQPKFAELQRFEVTTERKRSVTTEMAKRYNSYLPDFVSYAILNLAKPEALEQMGSITGVTAIPLLKEGVLGLDFAKLDVNSPTAYCSSIDKALKTQAMMDKMWGIAGLKELWSQGFLHLNGMMPKDMETKITPKTITGLFGTADHKIDPKLKLSLRDFALVNIGVAAIYQEQISHYLDPKTKQKFMSSNELNDRLDQLYAVGSKYDSRLATLKDIVKKTDWGAVKKAFEEFEYKNTKNGPDWGKIAGNVFGLAGELLSIATGEPIPGGGGKKK